VRIASVEHELILHCTRTHTNSKREAAILDLLTRDIDWKYLFALLARNRITSLFYYNLNRLSQKSLDNDNRVYLKQYYNSTIKHNLLFKGELLKIVQLLQTHNIRSIPFKGPMLAETIYGNIALREFADLDILVDENDYPAARTLLLKAGYKPLYPTALQDQHRRPRRGHHERFMDNQNEVCLELHWQLAEKSRYVLQEKILPWNFVTQIDIEQTQVETFTSEFLLLYLCFHSAKHQWERLSWVCDIAELINNQPDLDWKLVYEMARKFHLRHLLTIGILVADDLLGCNLPAFVRDQPGNHSYMLKRREAAYERFFPQKDRVAEQQIKGDEYYVSMYDLLSNPMHRAQYLFHFALGRITWQPNVKDYEWIHLPSRIHFLYYAIRPIRLIREYGAKHLRLVGKLFFH
jgi:hypothetical protein